jgi:hypothetical protein
MPMPMQVRKSGLSHGRWLLQKASACTRPVLCTRGIRHVLLRASDLGVHFPGLKQQLGQGLCGGLLCAVCCVLDFLHEPAAASRKTFILRMAVHPY